VTDGDGAGAAETAVLLAVATQDAAEATEARLSDQTNPALAEAGAMTTRRGRSAGHSRPAAHAQEHAQEAVHAECEAAPKRDPPLEAVSH
jgi:hypothetical protein